MPNLFLVGGRLFGVFCEIAGNDSRKEKAVRGLEFSFLVAELNLERRQRRERFSTLKYLTLSAREQC